MTGAPDFCYALIDMRYPWLSALSLLGIGFYIAGAIILGVLGGKWLDDKFGVDRWWTIGGLVLGIIVAVYGTYNMLRPFIKSVNKNGNNKKE